MVTERKRAWVAQRVAELAEIVGCMVMAAYHRYNIVSVVWGVVRFNAMYKSSFFFCSVILFTRVKYDQIYFQVTVVDVFPGVK